MPSHIAVLFGFLCALTATILLFLFVLPNRKNGRLPPALQWLRDVLTFKKLYLEVILRAFYIFFTCLSIFWGFFLLFSREEYYSYGMFGGTYYESTFLEGLVLLILGPILLRVSYEFAMLLIMAVKNLMEINHKMPTQPASCKSEPTDEPNHPSDTQCAPSALEPEESSSNDGLE